MIVVHIGLRKAGSASLQAFLAANDEALRLRGVDYPPVGRIGPAARTAHANLALELRGVRRFDPEFGTLTQLAERWRSSPAETLIVSSEMFEDSSTEDAVRLGGLLRRGGEEVRIVLIVRDLAALMASSYGQKVKYGLNTYDFDTFFAQRIEQPRVDYHRTARRWARAFGWDSLRVFPLRPDGDLIGDFLDVAGIERAGLEPTAAINITPGWKVLEAVRGLYLGDYRLPDDHLFADAPEHVAQQRRVFGELAMAVGERWGWNAERGRYLSAGQAQRCDAVYRRSLEALNRDLGADLRPTEALSGDRPFLPSVHHVPDLPAFYDAVALEGAGAG